MKSKIDVKYLPTFYYDLLSAVSYISDVLMNPIAANRFVDEIEQAILKESQNPGITEEYRAKRNLDRHYYKIKVGNYFIFYTIENSVMTVCRLIYTRRNIIL